METYYYTNKSGQKVQGVRHLNFRIETIQHNEQMLIRELKKYMKECLSK